MNEYILLTKFWISVFVTYQFLSSGSWYGRWEGIIGSTEITVGIVTPKTLPGT